MKALPVVDNRFTKQARRENQHISTAPSLGLRDVLATNAKTIRSVNFPIGQTCQPSAVCQEHCYAGAGHFLYTNTVKKQLAVLDYFKTTPTQIVARKVYDEAKSSKLQYLRWCGSGDLFQEAVEVINLLSTDPSYGDLVNVVYSRIPSMINQLVNVPGRLVINVSLDSASSTLPSLITHPNVRYTYLRTDANDAPPVWTKAVPLEIVFQLHSADGTLPHDSRDCPVDAGRMPVAKACQLCKRCFLPVTQTAPMFDKKYGLLATP